MPPDDREVLNLLRDMRGEVRDDFKALHAKVDKIVDKQDEHVRDDKTVETTLRNEISAVREEHSKTRQMVAGIVGERTGERTAEGFGPNGTGRHHVVPEQGSVVIPTPPLGVPIDIRIGKQTHSTPPVISWFVKSVGKAASSGIGKGMGALALFAAGVFIRHVAQPPPETKIVTVEVPMSASAVATTSPPPTFARAPEVMVSASVSFTPDAGPAPRRH